MFQGCEGNHPRTWWAVLLAFCLISSAAMAQSGPTISAVAATSVAASSDIISWATDTPSDSQVEFGATASYGSITVRDTVPMTSHTMALVGLAPGTVYYYRVQSRNAAGNLSVSGDFSFATPAVGPGNTFYVDTNSCSDSFAGTAGQPWCTLGHASAVLAPGDTVIVQPWASTMCLTMASPSPVPPTSLDRSRSTL